MLTEVLEAIRIAAVMLSPVTPALARAIYQQLGYTAEESQQLRLSDAQWGGQCRCVLVKCNTHCAIPFTWR